MSSSKYWNIILGTSLASLILMVGTRTTTVLSASGSNEIYILTDQSSSMRSDAPHGYEFRSIGTVPGAQNLALPEVGRHILVLTDTGSVWTWGDSSGQVGRGDVSAQSTWEEVKDLGDVTAVGAGTLHSVALKRDGTVWTWGANQQGQLGNGNLVSRLEPGAVLGLSDVKAVAAGWAFTLAVRMDGTVWAWGANWNGIASGENRLLIMQPVQVSGLSGIEGVAVYQNRGYAKDSQGNVWAWGKSGQSQDGAITQLSQSEISQLAPRIVRQLGNQDQAPTLQADWQAGLVQISESAVAVTTKGATDRFAFEGAVRDVDWGWAVGMITTPSAAGTANANEPSTTAANTKLAPVAAAAPMLHPRGVVATSTLAGSQAHGLVVRSNGTACSMGENSNGQLGDATVVDRWVPTQVSTETGLTSISKIATGYYHSLALKTDGTIWGWGYNADGELGDGTTIAKPTPFPAGGSLTGVVSVAAGQYHSLAAKSDGTVWAWGYNSSGQLGDGTTTGKTTPVHTILLTGVIQVVAGQSHSLALKSDGTVWAWGYNGYGQLGNGTTTNSTSAVQVTGLTGVTRIDAGANYSIALKSDGTVWTWGYNGNGELGDGDTTSVSSITNVFGLTNIVDIAAGDYHALALRSDGTVWAWGYNAYGEIGDGTTTQRLTPVQANQLNQAPGFTSLTGVSAGTYYSMALKSDGTVWAWGHNDHGQLGIGNTTDSSIPAQSSSCILLPVSGSTIANPLAARLSASQGHSIGIRSDGTVWAWGENNNGELGNGTTVSPQLSPVQAQLAGSFTQVATGWYHTLALSSARTVWAWGYNSDGELGLGNTSQPRPTPVQVPSLSGLTGVSAGQYHSLAVKYDGTVWSWGYNGQGQLGDGSTTQRTSPVQVILLNGVIQVAAGENHSLALKSDGTVWGWGDNSYGELGIGNTTNQTSVVQVKGLNNIIWIAAGAYYSMALRNDGTVWAWGANSNGDLGEGSSTYRPNIVRVSGLNNVTGGLTNVTSIAAGQYHSMAVRSDGSVWAWGYNGYGELGNITTTSSTTPVQATQASGLTAAFVAAAGQYNSLAVKSDGTVWAFGHNNIGQFGNGLTSDSTIPVAGWPAPVFTPPGAPYYFVPVTPCRVTDTRNPTGPFGGPSITGGTSRSFAIPSSACGIPSTATAYSLNVTVVPHGSLTYLTLWPTGQAQPLASTLNSLDGRVKANAAVTPAGTSGAVSVFATDTTDVILDINGYFVPTSSSSTLKFFPLAPCRVVDTRNASGPLGGPSMATNQSRAFPVLSSGCGVPSTAKAYSLNFTVVPQGTLGYITAWPTGEAQPLVSTLNAIGGQITANAAIVPAGSAGDIDVFATNNTDLVIDVNGYFAPDSSGLSLYTMAPCRVLDTRNPSGSPPFSGTETVSVAISQCPLLGTAEAYVFNATVVPSGSLGYLTLWPEGQAQVGVSTLNALDGAITSNMAIVPTANGYINDYATNPTQLILDISGYFAP